MKIQYKIVWLDDKPDKMRTIIEDIEAILRENFYIPDIKAPYLSYEDFQKSFQGQKEFEAYGEVFNDCDLLLIDNNIAENQENDQKTGAVLISQLRAKGIFTETVFYSDAMKEFRREPNRPELDNVIYADKSELIIKVEKLVKKNVIKSMIISNLRGYLMDCTSDFDFICRTVSEYYFEKLDENKQNIILEKAESYIHSQYKNENDKFEKINRKYKGICDFKKANNLVTFSNIPGGSERITKLRRVFRSMESVIVVKDKFRLMAQILQINGIENYSDIYFYDGNETDENKKNKDEYYNAIIAHRNKLAHNKLIYGKSCKNRIKIIETVEDMDCECLNNQCDKSYSYDECKKIREDIYNYYLLFNSLFEKVMSSLKIGKE